MRNYKEYVPNERIVDRACALWVQMLRNPKYDNGDNSYAGAITQTLAHMVRVAKPTPLDAIDRFGVELKKILMAPLEWEAKAYKEGEPPTKYTSLFNYLSVDYGPDIPLSTAAKRAGLEMEFPWKTSMSLREEYLSLGYGYGAAYVYHYPLSGDRWLETTLSGDDMHKIIELVEGGLIDLNLAPIVYASS